MHPIDPISIHIHQGYCYFEPFQETDQEARLPLYRSNWWGKIWAWLGFALKLQVEGTDKVYYVDKKNLNAWIKKYQGTAETNGNYQERIAQIIEIVQKQQWQKKREDKLIEIVHQIRSEQLKDVKANARLRLKPFIDKLKSQTAAKQVMRLQQEKDDTEMCLKEDKYIFYFGDEKIIARPDRMETSHYFKHFLSNKNRRVISLQLDLFAGMLTNVKKPTYSQVPETQVIDGKIIPLDPFVYETQPIEIDQDVFEILKLYLEGKPEADSNITVDLSVDVSSDVESASDDSKSNSASNEDKLLDGEAEIAPLLTIPVLESLYELHQIIDISGILEIAYRNIDFYSQEKMEWEGRQVSPQEFWAAFANKHHDKRLKEVYEEKYRSATFIESFLKKPINNPVIQDNPADLNATQFDNALNSTCLFETQINSDGTNSIILKFNFDPHYQNSNYYTHKLKVLSDLIDSHFEEAHISKIIVDVSKIRNNSDYINRLMDSINQDLACKQNKRQLELVFQNGSKFNKLEVTPNFTDLLRGLLNNYACVSFHDFQENFESNGSFNIPKNVPFAKSETYINFELVRRLEPFILSVDFQRSISQRDLVIQYQPAISRLTGFDFSPLSNYTNFTLEATGAREPWKTMSLSDFPFQRITFKNIVVNSHFIRDLKTAKNLIGFNLQDCEIEPSCQAEVETLLASQNQAKEAFERLNRVIKNYGNSLQGWNGDEYCRLEAKRNLEGTHLLLKFGLMSSTNINIDPAYQIGQAPSAYHQQQLSLLSQHLTHEQLEDANIKSIGIDFGGIATQMEKRGLSTVDILHYIGQLLDHVHHYFDIGNKQHVRFIIANLPKTALDYTHKQPDLFMLVLKEMLKTHIVRLKDCIIFNSIAIEQLFNFLQTDKHKLVAFSSPINNSLNSLSLSLDPSTSLEPELEFLFDQNDFDLSVLSTIQHPTHLILEQTKTNGKPWNASHLSQLSVKNLTIRNAVLNEDFITKLYDEEESAPPFPHLEKLTLKDCKIEPEIKEIILNYFLQLSDQRADDAAFCEVNFVDQE